MSLDVSIEHIGGIRRAKAEIQPGLNVIRGTNWQGKSSFVEAIETGLGVPGSVTEGATEGHVRMQGDGVDVDVTLTVEDGTTRLTGTPLLDADYDTTRAELYACLDERNPVRRAVRNGENLEEVLSRPLDFENIDERITELKREREEIDAERAKAEEARKGIPNLTERIETLEGEIEDREVRLDELDAEGEDGVSETRDALSQARSERDQLESRIERLNRSIERYTEQIEEKRSELEEISVAENDVSQERLSELRGDLDRLRSDIKILESLHQANSLVLEENRLDLVAEVERGLDTDAITCWVCGTETTREDVTEYVGNLRKALQERRSTLDRRQNEVEALEAELEQRQQAERRKRTLEADIQDLESELADREETRAELQTDLEETEARIEDLASAVDESVEELTDIESEIKFRKAELEDAEDELEQLQKRASQLEHLQEQREEVTAELNRLRDRKSEIKRRTREAFHETMQDIVDRFETGFETARLTPTFDIVVAREGHEASLDALSEGELELLGFVAAVAGYEAFDVAESVPFLLIDGVEGLDDENLHRLVEYFKDRSEFLVVTAHPEHTGFDGQEIDPGEWEVVSDRSAQESPA